MNLRQIRILYQIFQLNKDTLLDTLDYIWNIPLGRMVIKLALIYCLFLCLFYFPSRILQSQIFFWIWNQPGDVTWLIHNYETDIRSNSYQHKRHQKVSFSLPQFSWNSAASISFGPPSGTIGRKPI